MEYYYLEFNRKRFYKKLFASYISPFIIGAFLPLLFIFSSPIPTHAKIIWVIGINNNSNSEFGLARSDPNLDQDIVKYQVPENWKSRDAAGWKSFPAYLWPPDPEFHPNEIHISYNYITCYRSTLLYITARSDDVSQYLLVEKGGKEISDPNRRVDTKYEVFDFPLGFMQKGIQQQNKIILKNFPMFDNLGILFDYLVLDDQDEDGDWSLNHEELDKDTDNDGTFDEWDPDTATLLIQNKKRITFDIDEQGDPNTYFRKLSLMDQNAPDFPSPIPEDMFFPYCLFSADIRIPDKTEEISLSLIYSEKIYPQAGFYLYQGTEGWQAVPIKFGDGNKVALVIEVKENKNKKNNLLVENMEVTDQINLVGGLAYPRSLNYDIEDPTCFISTLFFPFPPPFFDIVIIFFLLFIILAGCLDYLYSFVRFQNNLMKKYRIKKYIITMLIICVFLHAAIAYAIILPDMKMNATPNPVGSGARALGIGGAFISIADDATAASWNPGALINLKRPELSIVGSYFSGRKKYNTSPIEGNIDGLSSDQQHLNYFSAAFPFFLFQRNMVFSLNYQHVYEFSKNTFYTWTYHYDEPGIGNIVNIPIISHKRQTGALTTLSPAFAVQVIPTLYFGFTTNLWLDEPLNNYWENLNIINGEGTAPGGRIKTTSEVFERYEFSNSDMFHSICFNHNIGVLWRPNLKFTLGGVIKTPFKARLRHEYKSVSIEEYPENPDLNTYTPISFKENLTLEMPMSFGLGGSIRFSDFFLMAMDIYLTKWDGYLLHDPNSSEKISPINNKYASEADIKSTIQIRLGSEYLMNYQNIIIPIRTGIFYDPEPDGGCVDDFYGVSLGTGIIFKNLVFDIAYQYRSGHKKEAVDMLGKKISSKVEQHYLYTSMIYYF